MIVFESERVCLRCGAKVQCIGVDWYLEGDGVAPKVAPVDCVTGRWLEVCPECGATDSWFAAGAKGEKSGTE